MTSQRKKLHKEKDGVPWTQTEDVGHCLALCALMSLKISTTLDTICRHVVMLLKQRSFCFFGLHLINSVTDFLFLKTSFSWHLIHLTLFSIYLFTTVLNLLKVYNKMFISNPGVFLPRVDILGHPQI